MRIIAKGTIERYGREHADALEPLRSWYSIAKNSQWSTPEDIKRLFASASFLAGNRVVFNIKGNSYRLVVKVTYKRPAMKHGIVYIIRILTHAAYNKVDVTKLRHEH
ncbi:MAG: type II toxin-antitoxin system HigB family toxin [Flavobacteriales bacterium]|jgi:mRNA interferase HigB|nr:type II toxin-antitoxin system HigB family toxin [Flavobacteriales bacterium]MBZ0205693.1 type II toxin-antitoxin system HigB family toxin [Flavobacteriales bacterium]